MTSNGSDPAGPDAGGGTQTPADAGDIFTRIMRPAAAMLETYARVVSQAAEGLAPARPPQAGGAVAPVELPAAMIEAAAIASASGLRYAQRLAEVASRHEAMLVQAAVARLSAAETTEEARRAAVERFRQYLREVGQTALLEAQRLEHELERLGEAAAQAVSPPGSAAGAPRGHEVKP